MSQTSDWLIETWSEIGRYLGLSKRGVQRRKRRLMDGGYVFTRKRKQGEKEVVCAWNYELRRYVEDRAKEGKIV